MEHRVSAPAGRNQVMVCIDTSRENVLRNVTLPKKSRTKNKTVCFYKIKVYNRWKRHSSNTLRTNSVSTHLFRQNPARNIPSKSHVSETCKAEQKRKKKKNEIRLLMNANDEIRDKTPQNEMMQKQRKEDVSASRCFRLPTDSRQQSTINPPMTPEKSTIETDAK